jgi:hypothetical protein
VTPFDDSILRAALAPARDLKPTEADVARALDAAESFQRRGARRRGVAIALVVAAILSSGAYAVPVTRAGIDGAFDAFAGWLDGGDGRAPGRALRPADDAPGWVRETGAASRLIAEARGVELYAVRTPNGELAFALDGSVGIADSPEGWREQFREHALVVLGPGGVDGAPFDEVGRRPLFGVTARSVTQVVLHYTSGAPLVADRIDGGFVLLADARRRLREIVAYDATGQEVERTDVSNVDLRVCRDERGCPPGRLEP